MELSEITPIPNATNDHHTTRISPEGETLPYLKLGDKSKRRVLVQRSKTFSTRHQHVPAPGNEYDFRRTPDPGRASPRKQFQGQIRPYIPPDTAELDALRLQECPTPPPPTPVMRNRLAERLDVARCPTPLPTEENIKSHTLQYFGQPLDSARAAWTKGGGFTNGEDLADDTDMSTPRYMANKNIHKVSRVCKYNGRVNKYDVLLSDVDRDGGGSTPGPEEPLILTENVLHYYFQKPVDKDKRIVKWLVDCESKSCHQLPAHFPDITASRRNVTVTFEDES